MRVVRRDTLPENTRYPDQGCRMSDTCLACPLPVCIEDDPTLNWRLSRAARDGAIVKAYAAGATVPQLAADYGVSTRTVHRVRQHARDGYVAPGIDELEAIDISLEQLTAKSLFKQREPWPKLMTSERDNGTCEGAVR